MKHAGGGRESDRRGTGELQYDKVSSDISEIATKQRVKGERNKIRGWGSGWWWSGNTTR